MLQFEPTGPMPDNVAEWSKAPALGAGLARGVGSNPTVVKAFSSAKCDLVVQNRP